MIPETWTTQRKTSLVKPISTVKKNSLTGQAALDDPCQLNTIAGGTMPCVEREHVPNNELIQIKSEMCHVQKKINQLEDRLLERNLIFQGISESIPDDVDARKEKLYSAISISRDTPEERLQLAREVEIIRTRRLGKPDPPRIRPISIEFSNKYDVEQIYTNRFNIEESVFVDREFCYATEKDRGILRPILKAAKNLPEYKKKCRLEGNNLVLDGKRYSKENLHRLPKKLDPMKLATKSSEEASGFFGELYPLSNFHSSPFLYNEVYYHSSEQMVQHMKAKALVTKWCKRKYWRLKLPLNANSSPRIYPILTLKPGLKKLKSCAKKDWKPNSYKILGRCKPYWRCMCRMLTTCLISRTSIFIWSLP